MRELQISKVIYSFEDENEIKYTIEKINDTYHIKKVECYLYSEDECDELVSNKSITEYESFERVYCNPNIQFKCNRELNESILTYELWKRNRIDKIKKLLNDYSKFYHKKEIKRFNK